MTDDAGSPTPTDGSGQVPAIDPSTLPRDAPVQDERWPVTLDGISREEAERVVAILKRANIACHLQTISPRVPGMEWEGVTGLFEVCVREEDLRTAVGILTPEFPERFPGEKLPDDASWDMTAFGPEPIALCRLSWTQSWDLEATLGRAGVKAIVLPDDMGPPAPPGVESLGHELEEGARSVIRHLEDMTDIGPGTPGGVPVEDRMYVVVVLKPDVEKATDIATRSLGAAFQLDGSAYDG